MRDLENILVLSLEQAVAAPLCSCRLAESGARVIKVERESGDFARHYDGVALGESAYFVWLNRGKESLIADIKNPEDAALLRRIAAQADVFIQNLAPGAAARAGLGSSDLRRANPKLITVDISGYGEGPYADMKAYDLLVQAETGLCTFTGTPDGPGRVGVSVCDIACGMNAHTAVLRALYRRERTGEGTSIRTSLFSGMADWMTVPYLHRRYGGTVLPRLGLNHPSIAPYGAYPARCGRMVLISIQNEREWKSLCENVLDNAHLVEDSRFCSPDARQANRAELDQIVVEAFSHRNRPELMDILRKAKIACGALNDIDDFIAHPHLKTVSYETPGGVLETVAPPVETEQELSILGTVPELGAHSDALRKEFLG